MLGGASYFLVLEVFLRVKIMLLYFFLIDKRTLFTVLIICTYIVILCVLSHPICTCIKKLNPLPISCHIDGCHTFCQVGGSGFVFLKIFTWHVSGEEHWSPEAIKYDILFRKTQVTEDKWQKRPRFYICYGFSRVTRYQLFKKEHFKNNFLFIRKLVTFTINDQTCIDNFFGINGSYRLYLSCNSLHLIVSWAWKGSYLFCVDRN